MAVKLAGYLEKRRAGYVAVVDVPPSQREAVGRKRLTKGLGTRDVHIANAKLPRALAGLHDRIASALRKDPTTDPLLREALELRQSVADVRSGKLAGWGVVPVVVGEDQYGLIEEDPQHTAMGLLSDGIERRAEAIKAEQGDRRAGVFFEVAMGVSTPMTLHIEDWLAEPGQSGPRRGRTSLDYRGIATTFATWAAGEGTGTVEGLTRPLAGRYLSKLHAEGLSPARIGTVVSALATFWEWMAQRRDVGEADRNPWRGQAPKKATRTPRVRERGFTDAEVVTLLSKAPDLVLHDLMLIGALTGARIEEICGLTVAMCAGGVFALPGTKTEAAARQTPIHPGLAMMIADRCKDRPATAYLLHELGDPTRFGERSGAIGKRFGRWRQTVGVHDRADEQRRSKANFHSFRRWFISKALRAEQPTRLVSQVVGHRLQGMTEGRYFSGDTIEALRACVEAVKLPEAALVAVPKFLPPAKPRRSPASSARHKAPVPRPGRAPLDQ